MNHFAAFAKPLAGGSFAAMVRTAKDGKAQPLLGSGGQLKVYEEKLHALEAAVEHLLRYINGHMVRDGEVAGTTRREIESHFAEVVRPAKTRVITVAYKKRGRACRTQSKG